MANLSNLSTNIPLLEAIQDIPGYAKLMKKLILKKKIVECDTIEVTHGCSSIMSCAIVENKEDPDAFTIPCTIGKHKFEKVLCDLGASISLMPFAIKQRLGLSTPILMPMRLLMEDRSIKKPVGVLFDVLVSVDKFILLAHFVVIDCEVDQVVPIILCRSFLATSKAIVDLELGEMRLRINDGEKSYHYAKQRNNLWSFKCYQLSILKMRK
ncbi:uncharacterized protein LOC107858385 [Capsicum annuum]|uniref:uncharacterized protein LOC107858385 n=1 Tax=Capsicum annuum TaxID=4072 RepID=UPI0007BEBDBB|nr:uncharacterized protein LOC107858385 [Capsicum annuum]